MNVHYNTIKGIIKLFKVTGRITQSHRNNQYFRLYERNYFPDRNYIEVLDLATMGVELPVGGA